MKISMEDLLDTVVEIAKGALPESAAGTYCGVDSLEEKGFGISIQMAMVPRFIKRYIYGGGIRQCSFTVLAQAIPGKGQTAITWLGDISEAFADRPTLATGVRVTESEETTPSIIGRMQDGTVRYGTTITLTYPEE
jgi:hypothetical protein